MQKSVQLTKIDTSIAQDCRDAVDDNAIKEYAESLAILPTPQAVFDGKTYWLWDGYHRFRASQLCDYDSMAIEITEGTKRDAEWKALGSNSKHGIRRTNADRRKAVIKAVTDDEWSKLTNRELAKACGVSHTFVNTIRDELSASGNVSTLDCPNVPTPARIPDKIGDSTTPADDAEIVEAIESSLAVNMPEACDEGKSSTPQVEATIPPAPWAEFETQIRGHMQALRCVADGIRNTLEYDSESKQLQSKWAADYSYQGTVGAINQLVRELDNGLPVRLDNTSPCGYANARRAMVDSRTSQK